MGLPDVSGDIFFAIFKRGFFITFNRLSRYLKTFPVRKIPGKDLAVNNPGDYNRITEL